MRAIAGAVHSSTPCSLAKATRVIAVFTELNATNLPSSDAATYLRTVAEAANDLHIFRRGLRRPQGDVAGGAHESGGAEASERRRRHAREAEDGVTVVPAVVGSQGASAAAGENKSGKRKGSREDEDMKDQNLDEDKEFAAADRGLHSPASEKRKKKEKRKEVHVKEENVSGDVNQEVDMKALVDGSQGSLPEEGDDEKRARKERKKEKRVKVEDESGDVNAEESRKALDDGLHGLVSEGGVESEKKAKKKKKHVKQEEEVMGAMEAEQKIVHGDLAEHGVASEEKKRKKRKHAEEEEEKKEIVMNGDLGSEKKRKKKRERDGDDGNEKEFVEHTIKKQRQ